MEIKSILTDNFSVCYFCGQPRQHIHHIMNAANKKKAEKFGLLLPVCFVCHSKIHDGTSEDELNMLVVRQLGQRKFEEIYSRELWMQEFGKNYLMED